MFNISQYLEKFKNFGQGERRLKEIIISAVKETVGVSIEANSIFLKNGELIFKVSPVIKNTIYINKEKILTKIKDQSSAILNEIR